MPDKGIRAVKDAVGEILGLPVDYYMMVDLEGFREVVDALGGITVNVKERVSYGAIKASGAIGRSQGFIEPGLQQMDGETACCTPGRATSPLTTTGWRASAAW